MSDLSNINSKRNLWFLKNYIPKYKLSFLFLLISIAIITYCILDFNLIFKNFSFSGPKIFNFFVCIVCIAIASSARIYLIETTSEKIINDIKLDIYKRIIRQSPRGSIKTETSEIITLIFDDTRVIKKFIICIFSFFIRNFILIIGSIIFLIKLNIMLTVTFIILTIISFILFILFFKRLKLFSYNLKNIENDCYKSVNEVLHNVKSVQAYNKEDYECRKLQKILNVILENTIIKTKCKAGLVFTFIISVSLSTLFIIWFGLNQNLSNSALILFIFNIFLVAFVGASMTEVLADFKEAQKSANRITKLLYD